MPFILKETLTHTLCLEFCLSIKEDAQKLNSKPSSSHVPLCILNPRNLILSPTVLLPPFLWCAQALWGSVTFPLGFHSFQLHYDQPRTWDFPFLLLNAMLTLLPQVLSFCTPSPDVSDSSILEHIWMSFFLNASVSPLFFLEEIDLIIPLYRIWHPLWPNFCQPLSGFISC